MHFLKSLLRTTRIRAAAAFTGSACCVVIVVLAVDSLSGSISARDPRQHVTGVISFSEATAYTSLNALSAASSSVALVQAQSGASTFDVNSLPETNTTLQVVKTLAGAALPSTITLNQAGEAGTAGAAVVEAGDMYIVFLTSFSAPAGQPSPSSEYAITGGLQGLFEQTGANATSAPATAASPSAQSFVQAAPASDPDAPGLPTSISISQAESS